MNFRNIKEVDEYYKYPMSYRIGSIYDDKGIIRSYSNGKKSDYKRGKFFYYELKNDFVKQKFKMNINNKKKLRLIVKTKIGVNDEGLYNVSGFYKNYVRLQKWFLLYYFITLLLKIDFYLPNFLLSIIIKIK